MIMRDKARRSARAALFCLLLCGCEEAQPNPVSFDSLPGWREATFISALPALRRSCDVLKNRNDWQKACAALAVLPAGEKAIRSFLEKYFQAFGGPATKDGLYTGYYEASLHAARKRGGVFQTPLWPRPDDLIVADLGAFDPSFTGKEIIGKIERGRLVPYDSREDIENGSLKGRARPLAFVSDPVEAFFLQTQGSGRLFFADGGSIHVGVAAKNGRPYVHIGPILVKKGELKRPLSADDIKKWLRANPGRAQAVMNLNPSFIFFREKEQPSAAGAMGVVLTPMHSLAVDPAFVPMGSPLWLVTGKRQTLVVAQDTGSAIKGPLRGDLFWGAGQAAEKNAGAMQERGRFYILKPRKNP